MAVERAEAQLHQGNAAGNGSGMDGDGGIAVVIPCHNAARFLARALDSALVQTRPARTIYVVDDASTDETAAIAGRYVPTYPNVRLIRFDTNAGPATARNAALNRATESFVAFLDADDYWLPDHLAVLAGQLEMNPRAVLAFSRVSARGGDPPHPPHLKPGRPANMLRSLLVDNLIPQSATMARRDRVLKVGGYLDGVRYAEDYDLWLRLALEGDFVYSGKVTAVRNLHDAQATRRTRQMSLGAWDARERLWNRAVSNGKPFSESTFRACCQAAYEMQLRNAWRARDGSVLRETVRIADRVPGGHEQVRSWRWRMRWLWPVWRVGAAIWDRLPDPVRAPVRRRRTERAFHQAQALRSPQGFAGALDVRKTPAARS